jgi:hypothetical protein
VICYVPPSCLSGFFACVAAQLEEGGLIFVQYPHALRRTDLWNPDLLYTKYSPKYLSRVAADWFDMLEHHHSFHSDKIVEDFDPEPFPMDSFVNGYLYIGRKRPGQ